MSRMDNAIAYVSWVKLYKKSPRSRSEDKVESNLGYWISKYSNKYHNGSDYPNVSAYLIKELGPELFQTKEEIAMAKAKSFVKWVEDHGHMPRYAKKDKEEHSKYTWFHSYMASLNINMGYEKITEYLVDTFGDNILSIYSEPKPRNKYPSGDERVVQYIDWVNSHNSRPYANSEDSEERQLSGWINNISTNPSTKNLGYLETIKSSVPEDLSRTNEEKSMHHAEEFIDWIMVHNSFPKLSSKNPLEIRLGNWYVYFKNNGAKYTSVMNYIETAMHSMLITC